MSNQEKIDAIYQEIQSILNSYCDKKLSTRNAFELKDKVRNSFIGLAVEGIMNHRTAIETINSLHYFLNLETNEIKIVNDDKEVNYYRKNLSTWKEF